MGVSQNKGTHGYLQIMNFNRVFHHKPSILVYPYFWKQPYWRQDQQQQHPSSNRIADIMKGNDNSMGTCSTGFRVFANSQQGVRIQPSSWIFILPLQCVCFCSSLTTDFFHYRMPRNGPGTIMCRRIGHVTPKRVTPYKSDKKCLTWELCPPGNKTNPIPNIVSLVDVDVWVFFWDGKIYPFFDGREMVGSNTWSSFPLHQLGITTGDSRKCSEDSTLQPCSGGQGAEGRPRGLAPWELQWVGTHRIHETHIYLHFSWVLLLMYM